MKISKLTKKHDKKTLVIVIIISIALVSILGVFIAGLAMRPSYLELQLIDEYSGDDVTSESNATLYRADISNLTNDEISDLEFSDYEEVFEKNADEVSHYMDSDKYNYYLKTEYKGSVKWTIPEAGTYTIYTIEKTDNLNVILEDKNKNQTFTNNDNTDYTSYILADDEKGFIPSTLYDEGYYSSIWLRFNFSSDVDGNTTINADKDWLDIPNYGGDYELDDSYLYVGLTTSVIETAEIGLEFSNGKASDYYLVGVDVGIGTFDGDQDDLTLY